MKITGYTVFFPVNDGAEMQRFDTEPEAAEFAAPYGPDALVVPIVDVVVLTD